MYDGFIGSIVPWAGSWEPQDWLFCCGQTLPVNNLYMPLFAVLGNRYGGDGKTTFKLPDLQQKFPMGAGAGTSMTVAVAQTGGTATGQMTVTPYHSHTFNGTVSASLSASTTGGTLAGPAPANAVGVLQRIAPSPSPIPMYATTLTGTASDIGQLAVTAPTVPAASGTAGATTPSAFNTLPPFQVLNYLICYNGVFPIRS